MHDNDSDRSSVFSDYHTYYKPRSPPATPPRAEPVLGYEIKFIEGGGSQGKCM